MVPRDHNLPILSKFRAAGGRKWIAASLFAVASSWGMDSASAASPTIGETVAEHVAAGEFGLATNVALTAPDAGTQSRLLQTIADRQAAVGERDAAYATSRRMPQAEERGRAVRSLGGGGVQADFTSLMTLIQDNTSGMWEQVDGEGGTMTPFFTGVRVDPKGLLAKVSTEEVTGELAALSERVRDAAINEDMAQPSNLRLVSMRRLEQAVADSLDEGRSVPESMARMAGLTRVTHVFVAQDDKDIILGGPAEAWQYDGKGQIVGVESGRPVLNLDDFVVVLRAFLQGQNDFGCSINVREEGVKALSKYVEESQAKGPLAPGALRGWTKNLQDKLGRQDVVVWGIPADSRAARVIVEADYRMKLIGIDKLDAGKEVPSYFDLLTLSQQKNVPTMDALRWWLTMKYDAVLHSADRTAFEIQGSSVLCQSENQLLTAEGKHVPTGKAEATNRQFAQNFTQHYNKLASRDAVFADTQNVFDLALIASLIQEHQIHRKIGWNFGSLGPSGDYQPAHYPAAREIDSVVNHRVYRGKDIVVQVAGGVSANVRSVLKDEALDRKAPELAAKKVAAAAPQLPVGRWWWDAK